MSNNNQGWPDEEWEAHMEAIGPDVMRVLEAKGFFTVLDGRVFPSRALNFSTCKHTHDQTLALLAEQGFSNDERDDIIHVLESRGGFCDCEVLLNAADGDDLPKERYWKEQAAKVKMKASESA